MHDYTDFATVIIVDDTSTDVDMFEGKTTARLDFGENG